MQRAIVLWLVVAACRATPQESYLYVWAGDSTGTASDFLGVIDAAPASSTYGAIVASETTGVAGTHPHHTEIAVAANGHLLANGFHAGRTWLFDLTQPRAPRVLASFGDVGGFSHPHTFVRLASGNVLSTFQYLAGSGKGAESGHAMASGPGMSARPSPEAGATEERTGGIVEMDERGTLIRAASASDTTIPDRRLYPYSVLPLTSIDRAVSTTTDMDDSHVQATSEWVQFWRLSDLTLLKSIALPAGPRGDEQKFTGEPLLSPDGAGVYIHTFNCGLYLLRNIEATPTATLVHAFEGKNCGVPQLAGHFWLQPVPDVHALVSMDVSDAEHPREVSRVTFGEDELPHWIALDPSGRRVVLNSGGSKGNRLFIVNVDPATGALEIDQRFRTPGSDRAGVVLTGAQWPHGFRGKAVPHGTVFSRRLAP